MKRRRAIVVSGSIGLMALAGCSTPGGEGDGEEEGEGGEEEEQEDGSGEEEEEGDDGGY